MNVERLENVSSGFRITPSVLGICFVIIAVVSYLRTLYRLRKFKGPFLAVTSKLWMLKCTYYKNAHWEFKRVCDQYGKAFHNFARQFRIASPILAYASILI